MSVPTIAPYFPFRRIKIVNQTVTPEATAAQIHVQPDKRFQPIKRHIKRDGVEIARL
ncbi:MAG: hypothetical protein H8D96_12640 [Desulfobacterales bacterium]|uniref:Uncharacterized protein n=1 Tax=Candidatus Desulfatibia vada TaxID=2841696 RepID=A0A8J6P3D8_9BACT|nr:hypothetical protein [Candidatus Desulfatibia vada]